MTLQIPMASTENVFPFLKLARELRDLIYEASCPHSEDVWLRIATKCLYEDCNRYSNRSTSRIFTPLFDRYLARTPADLPHKAVKVYSGFSMFENLPGLMFFYLNRQIRVEALEFISKHTVVSMISSDIKVSPRLEINVRKPPPLYCAICAASTLVEIHSIFKFPEQKGDYFGPTEELSLLRPQYLQNAEIVNITFHVSGDLNPKAITNVSGKYDDWPGPLQRLQWIFRNAPGLKVLRLIMIWSDQEHTIVDKVWVRRGSDTVDALAKMKDAFWDHVGEVKEIDVLGFTQGRVRDADVPAVVHDMSDEKD